MLTGDFKMSNLSQRPGLNKLERPYWSRRVREHKRG